MCICKTKVNIFQDEVFIDESFERALNADDDVFSRPLTYDIKKTSDEDIFDTITYHKVY